MKYSYKPQNVCPMMIEFELDGDVVHNVEFTGGCNGNLKAVSTLVDGMTVREVTEKLSGNTCGFRDTSCADQLTIALNQALSGQQ